VKSMVALTAPTDISAFDGKCVYVTMTTSAAQVYGSSVTWNVMCYASSINDDASATDTDGDGLSDDDEKAVGSCVSSGQTGCSGNCTGESTLAKTTDSDCDGITDTDEVAGLTDPTKIDTDNDGTHDGTDFTQTATWTNATATTRAIGGLL